MNALHSLFASHREAQVSNEMPLEEPWDWLPDSRGVPDRNLHLDPREVLVLSTWWKQYPLDLTVEDVARTLLPLDPEER